MTLDKKYTTSFKQIAKRINILLSKDVNFDSINIYFQNLESELEIPKMGIRFGCIYQDKCIILGKWLKNLSSRERKILIHFLLSKEIFRVILISNQKLDPLFQDFIEIILNTITILWCIEDLNFNSYYNRNIGFINQRMIYGENKEINLKWDRFFTIIYYSEINVKELFEKTFSIMKRVVHQNHSFSEFETSFANFIESLNPTSDFPLIPFQMKERYYQIFERMLEVSFKESSARKIGEYLGKKHDVINNAFREIMDHRNVERES